MAKRTYSDDEKADALLHLRGNGGDLGKTSRATGIPPRTLSHWQSGAVHPAVGNIAEGKRVPLAERLEALAHLCLDLLPGKLTEATASQCAVALGISLEKMRLLRNEATSITHDLSDEERADRAAALLERARARRAGQAPQVN